MHLLQAIQTKYLPATNNLGSRIKASAEAGSIIVPWDHSLGIAENHLHAAAAFAVKLGWKGDLHGGVMKGGEHVWVFGDCSK